MQRAPDVVRAPPHTWPIRFGVAMHQKATPVGILPFDGVAGRTHVRSQITRTPRQCRHHTDVGLLGWGPNPGPSRTDGLSMMDLFLTAVKLSCGLTTDQKLQQAVSEQYLEIMFSFSKPNHDKIDSMPPIAS